jgi:hypothetical protein
MAFRTKSALEGGLHRLDLALEFLVTASQNGK